MRILLSHLWILLWFIPHTALFGAEQIRMFRHSSVEHSESWDHPSVTLTKGILDIQLPREANLEIQIMTTSGEIVRSEKDYASSMIIEDLVSGAYQICIIIGESQYHGFFQINNSPTN